MNPITSTTSGTLGSNPAQGKEDGPTRWRKLLGRQRDSGLSVSAFCREQGITASSLFAWRRRLAGEVRKTFIEVKPPQAAAEATPSADEDRDGRLELRLRGGRRLLVQRGFDHDLLIDLVRTLEAMA